VLAGAEIFLPWSPFENPSPINVCNVSKAEGAAEHKIIEVWRHNILFRLIWFVNATSHDDLLDFFHGFPYMDLLKGVARPTCIKNNHRHLSTNDAFTSRLYPLKIIKTDLVFLSFRGFVRF
jgi:hypothetical protein